MACFAIIDAGRVTNIVEADSDFAQLQGWIPAEGASIGDLWDGESFTPAPPPPPAVPAAVTMRQARLALLGADLLDDVDAAIAALPSPQKEAAKIEWEYSQEVRRHNGVVAALGPLLGLTDAQIDDLFLTAAQL